MTDEGKVIEVLNRLDRYWWEVTLSAPELPTVDTLMTLEHIQWAMEKDGYRVETSQLDFMRELMASWV